MNKQREALQVALEALEKYGTPRLNNEDAYSAAIKTIREALAEPEPEQEPVAVAIMEKPNRGTWQMRWLGKPYELPIGTKLYTASPGRNPLTDDKIRRLFCENLEAFTEYVDGKAYYDGEIEFARAIERAHGIGDTE